MNRTWSHIDVGRDTIEFLHLMPDIDEERNVDGECDQGDCCSEERDQGGEKDHGDVREEGEDERDEGHSGGCRQKFRG